MVTANVPSTGTSIQWVNRKRETKQWFWFAGNWP